MGVCAKENHYIFIYVLYFKYNVNKMYFILFYFKYLGECFSHRIISGTLYSVRWVVGSLCTSGFLKAPRFNSVKKRKPPAMTMSNPIWVLSSSKVNCVRCFRSSDGKHCTKCGENLQQTQTFLIKNLTVGSKQSCHSMNGIILKTQSRHFTEAWWRWALSSHQSFSLLWILFGNPSLTAHC